MATTAAHPTRRALVLTALGGAAAGVAAAALGLVLLFSSSLDPGSEQCRTGFAAFVAGERAPELRATVRQCSREAY